MQTIQPVRGVYFFQSIQVVILGQERHQGSGEMFAKKCDRCKKLYTIERNEEKPMLRLSVHHPYKDRYYKPIDLCPKCREDLVKWFEKKSKKE